jgi:hypothetical protein
MYIDWYFDTRVSLYDVKCDFCGKDDPDFFEKGCISGQGKRKDLEDCAELVIDSNHNHSIAKVKPVGYMKFNRHVGVHPGFVNI